MKAHFQYGCGPVLLAGQTKEELATWEIDLDF